MPEVFEGAQAGLNVSTIVLRMADLLGYSPDSKRFKNACIGWINDTLQEIQLSDPKVRRTVVHRATCTIKAGVTDYDVRKTVPNGGFNWPNCFEVINLAVPGISSRSLETMSLDQWRNRSYTLEQVGPPYGWVLVDQFRIMIQPEPDKDYEAEGDYYQNIPSLTENDHEVDWPRPWDAVLMHGVKYRGKEWHFDDQPSAWVPNEKIYQKAIARLKSGERVTSQRPRKAVQTRYLRRRRLISSDNSADFR